MPTLEGTCYFSKHCNCVEFTLEKKKWKQLEKLALGFGKEKQKHGIMKVGENRIRIVYSTGTHVLAENKRRLIVSLYSLEEGKITVTSVGRLINVQEEYFNLLNGFNQDLVGKSCTIFAFDPKSHAPVGGLIVPTKIELTNEIRERIGEVQISGFALSFGNSPIGVTGIDIEMENDLLMISVQIEYKLSSIAKLPEKSFNMAKEVANLFVVRRL